MELQAGSGCTVVAVRVWNVHALALLPDGSLIAVGDGIADLDGQRWRHWWHGLWLTAVSVAPDGAIWVAGPNVYQLPPLP
jgi:hypothetical protein